MREWGTVKEGVFTPWRREGEVWEEMREREKDNEREGEREREEEGLFTPWRERMKEKCGME